MRSKDKNHLKWETNAKVSPGKYKNVGIKKTDSGAKRPAPPKPSSEKKK